MDMLVGTNWVSISKTKADMIIRYGEKLVRQIAPESITYWYQNSQITIHRYVLMAYSNIMGWYIVNSGSAFDCRYYQNQYKGNKLALIDRAANTLL